MASNDALDSQNETPPEDRTLLVQSLLRSLETNCSQTARAWTRVIREHLSQLNSGEIESAPGDNNFVRIWKGRPS